ncbi:hypothetical protein [Ktedonobacter racemifer]|uniref:Uncharacterized protein n=1 Tax=Ktedonobacter racemifer DSM 44963 TaxID=485913 RepID=D6U024_KTERA|nr:hypothetical protein [Ktedonobacter racemifer]EFH82164.1 hypothetical protein Krac_2949 [Ktedonobacter racemifer DSM 44963]
MAEPNFNAWNRQIIEEFRANGGKVVFFAYPPETMYSFRGDMQKKTFVSPLAPGRCLWGEMSEAVIARKVARK